MHVLLVYCHPLPTSFTAAVKAVAVRTLATAGHSIDVLDLYEERFDPVLSASERATYLADPAANRAALAHHVDRLMRAEGLVFVFPTWFYGPPAMLKGWLERVWLPEVTFRPPARKGERVVPLMRHVRLLAVLTSSGSPWWWLRVMGDPTRALFRRGLRALFHPRCETVWLQLHSMNNATAGDRASHLARVERRLARIKP